MIGTPPGVIHGEMQESVLANGLRILSERIPGVRSISVGVWIRQGAAHESPEMRGGSHLLEHMVFKGTGSRGPREIAMALERLGGSLDAFTSREHTSFQARVLPQHLPVALDVLADLVRDPLLREEDLELEREVVLEEISSVEDTPDDVAFEAHAEALWEGHPYGWPILGTRSSVEAIEARTLRELHDRRYRHGRLLVAAAGYLEHEAFVEEVARGFGAMTGGEAPTVPTVDLATPVLDVHRPRPGAQVHLLFGNRTPPRSHRARIPLILLSAALGGGMGSRLFQKVREELGLAYTVYSFQSFYSRAGLAGVYVGTRPEWGDRAVDAVRAEYAELAREGLPANELREVKNQVAGQVMLSLESTSARLFRLAGMALHDEPLRTLDELLDRVESVTEAEVAEVAARYLDPDRQTVLRMGPP